MKRIYTYIILMACAMLFASCQKDFDGILNAEIEQYQGDNGKVYIDGENFACWHNDDMVELFVTSTEEQNNGVDGIGYPIKIKDHTATIDGFTSTKATTEIRAAYPNWEGTKYYANHNGYNALAMQHPETQIYKEQDQPNGPSVQVVEAPMIAYYSKTKGDNTLKFKNAGALMKVTIPNTIQNANIKNTDGSIQEQASGSETDITVTSIKLTSNQPLSGTRVYTEDAGYLSGENSEQPKSVTLKIEGTENHPGIVKVNNSKSYYIAIPPVTDGTFEVEVIFLKRDQYYTFTSKTSQSNTIARNTIVNMTVDAKRGTIAQSASDGDTRPYLIESYADLSTRMNEEGGLSKSYKLMDNIALPSGFAGFGSNDTPFKGTFDGNGYTITNQSNNGVFAYAADYTIKNLKVVVSMNPTSTTKGGLINCTKNGDGNVASTIENCIVRGTITTDAQSADIIGGFIGKNDEIGTTLKKCINKVDITAKKGTIGGFIGTSKPGTFIDCVNKGNITSKQPKVGGFIGDFTVDGGTLSIYNSYSLGSVKGESSVGGLIGEWYTDEASICNIDNVYIDASITATNGTPYAILGHNWSKNKITFDCNKVFVPESFIHTDANGHVTSKDVYGGELAKGEINNVKAIPDNLKLQMTNGQAVSHSDEWSPWVDGVTGNNGRPGLDFENALLNTQTNP